jgi:RNA 3'-terminal phosphate cyclase (ATP)
MDWSFPPVGSGFGERIAPGQDGKRWVTHAGHGPVTGPHRLGTDRHGSARARGTGMIKLDGARGEGGGQILRSALTLSLLTGRPFRIDRLRANRDKPGLRPQHLSAVQAAAELGRAEVSGASVGSRSLTFRPGTVEPGDMTLDIGTAGSTALVLQTLHLPLALKAGSGVRVVLEGGTFNLAAPSFPFLATAWEGHLRALGLTVALSMPRAGFFPTGGGRLEAWIEPGQPRAIVRDRRGTTLKIEGEAGVSGLPIAIAERMVARVEERLLPLGIMPDLHVSLWPGRSPGAAIGLTCSDGETLAAFDGLGARGKPAEAVADEAVDALLAYLEVPDAAIDPHSADQILLPLALAEGRSVYTVSEATEHLRTNARTIAAFLDRQIEISDPSPGEPARVIVG